MSSYRHAASEVAHDEVELFVWSAEVVGSFSGHRLVIERVEERLPLKARKSETGISREWLELVNANRVYEERRDADRICELTGNVRAEVGSVLSVRRILDVSYDSVVYFVSPRRDVFEQSASAAYRVEVLKAITVVLDLAEDGFLSERSLVDDMGILGYLGSVVIDAYAHLLVLIVEHAYLRRSSARIDH